MCFPAPTCRSATYLSIRLTLFSISTPPAGIPLCCSPVCASHAPGKVSSQPQTNRNRNKSFLNSELINQNTNYTLVDRMEGGAGYLGCDPSVVAARHPQHSVALHSLPEQSVR